MSKPISFNSIIQSPNSGAYQAVFFLLMGILIMTIVGYIMGDKEMVYTFGSSVLLLFILFNAVIGVLTINFRKYVLRSTVAFIIMSLILMFCSKFFSMTPFSELPEFKMIYASLFVTYFMLIVVVLVIRKITEFLKLH